MHARQLERENAELRKTLTEQIIEADTMRKHYQTVEALLFEAQTENNALRKDADELILLNQAVTMLAGSPRSDEMDALIKEAKDEGYNQGFREGLAFKGKP